MLLLPLSCVRVFTSVPAAAQKCVAVCKQDWGSVQSEFSKRFDSQLKQELSAQGSSITGVLWLGWLGWLLACLLACLRWGGMHILQAST